MIHAGESAVTQAHSCYKAASPASTVSQNAVSKANESGGVSVQIMPAELHVFANVHMLWRMSDMATYCVHIHVRWRLGRFWPRRRSLPLSIMFMRPVHWQVICFTYILQLVLLSHFNVLITICFASGSPYPTRQLSVCPVYPFLAVKPAPPLKKGGTISLFSAHHPWTDWDANYCYWGRPTLQVLS